MDEQRGIVLPLIVLGIFAFILIIFGINYFQLTPRLFSEINNSQNVSTMTRTPNVPDPSASLIRELLSPTPALKTEALKFRKQTQIGNEETINLTMLVPDKWALQIIGRFRDSGDIIKGCADYVVTNEEFTAKLIISPVCEDRPAEYKNWPLGGEIIRESKNAGNDDHASLLVRYFDNLKKQYRYGEVAVSAGKLLDKKTAKISDALPVSYGSQRNFIPMEIILNYSGEENAKARTVETSDKIVVSLKGS